MGKSHAKRRGLLDDDALGIRNAEKILGIAELSVTEPLGLDETQTHEEKCKSPGLWRWRLGTVDPAYRWTYSVGRMFYLPFYFCVIGAVLTTSIPAIIKGFYSTGFLNIASLVLYMVTNFRNPYGKAPHKFREDMIRIAAPPLSNSSYRRGRRKEIVYTLPCRKFGFGAIWSVTLEYEDDELANVCLNYEDLLEDKSKELSRWRKKFREYLNAFVQRVQFTSDEQLLELAGWLVQDPEIAQMIPPPLCKVDGDHLISHDIIFALCVAEHIVFMNRVRIWRINRPLYDRLFQFRTFQYKGTSQIYTIVECGRNFTKWGDLVRYVYRQFQLPVGAAIELADKKHTTPPDPSPLFQRSFANFDEYTKELWKFCNEQNLDSAYETLYLFATIWRSEAGFCYPLLRPKNENGDMISWYVIWRQAWYQAGLTQLIALSPVVFSSFFSGGLAAM